MYKYPKADKNLEGSQLATFLLVKASRNLKLLLYQIFHLGHFEHRLAALLPGFAELSRRHVLRLLRRRRLRRGGRRRLTPDEEDILRDADVDVVRRSEGQRRETAATTQS